MAETKHSSYDVNKDEFISYYGEKEKVSASEWLQNQYVEPIAGNQFYNTPPKPMPKLTNVQIASQTDDRFEITLVADFRCNNDINFNNPKTGEKVATVFADGNYTGDFAKAVESVASDKYVFHMFGGLIKALAKYQKLDQEHKNLQNKAAVLIDENRRLTEENEKIQARLTQYHPVDQNKMNGNEGIFNAIKKVR
jgi:hypothetical protein